MITEEKQLLIKDLSARLPYNVIIHYHWEKKEDPGIPNSAIIDEDRVLDCSDIDSLLYLENSQDCWCTSDWKPYLRPMSSMTQEERKEYINECNKVLLFRFRAENHYPVTDWLLSHHFDFRGLIEKGLALEAPPEMYNKEESEKGSEVPIPKTVDEAIKILAKIVPEEDRDYLLENGAISMHNSLGRWIRNEWGLWTDSELKNELKKKGFEHPDDMSNYIIEEFIKYWNDKYDYRRLFKF